MLQNTHVFTQHGEGLGHDCYLVTIQFTDSITKLDLLLCTWANKQPIFSLKNLVGCTPCP